MTQNTTTPRWHSRGYLPHFEAGQRAQFLTLHLADSLPQEVLQNWRRMLEQRGSEDLARSLRIKIESYLDAGYGACYLRQEAIASTVENALLHFDGERYRLRSWVVMPNHIHFLLTPMGDHTLSQIMHAFAEVLYRLKGEPHAWSNGRVLGWRTTSIAISAMEITMKRRSPTLKTIR